MSPLTPAVLVRHTHTHTQEYFSCFDIVIVLHSSDLIVCVCVCARRWLFESGGSALEAAAGIDASEEESETGRITHSFIYSIK